MINTTHTSEPVTQASRAIRNQTGVLVTGASGLVGQALLERLRQRNQAVTKLVRKHAGQGEVLWDPANGKLDLSSMQSGAVVHLAGENIAEGRWTKSKMDAIRSSRVQGTRLLAEQLAKLETKPSVLVSASAIGYYGDRGHEVLDERSALGTGFLPEVCDEWERATEPARAAGIRVVNLRIGVVLAREGGALAKMLTPFKLGLGGRIGSGNQMMSWIALNDLVAIILRAIDDEQLEGAINATSPNPVSNQEFTKALGRVLKRPTIAAMPALAARLAFGRMAQDLLLASLRVYPQKLMNRKFEFEQPQLEGALRAILGTKP